MKTRASLVVVCTFVVGACGGSSTGQPGSPTISLTSPAASVYTHGTVAVQVAVNGGAPDSVELLKDTSVLVTLAPPYQYSWDTSATPEGSYELSARATRAGQTFTSAARTVVVDRTPPAVVSRTPSSGATNVFVNDPMTAEFSEPLLPASVSTSSIALTSNSVPVAIAPTLSADGKTVTLAREGSLAVPATLTLALMSAVTDLAGNALAPDSWSWTLPSWVALGGAVNAVAGQRVSSRPALALDGTGKPVVGFFEFDGTSRNAYVQRWTGTAWQPVGGPVNAVAGQSISAHPALALDGTGKPVVAFAESDGTSRNAYVQQWTGSAWQAIGGPVNAVAGQSIGINETPALALDGTGKPVVAFREFDGTYDNVYVQRWTGSAWQAIGGPVNAVAGRSIDSNSPQLALDGSGNPVVAFVEFDGTRFNAYLQRWTGSAWQAIGGAANAVAGQSIVGIYLALALDGTGKPVVAFEFDGTSRNAYVQQWTGSTWQAIGGPVNAVAGQSIGLITDLALDGTGKPVVALGESDGTRFNAYVQQWTGTVWQPVGNPVNAVSGFSLFSHPKLALDGTGRATVAFTESDGTNENLYVLRSNR